MPRPIWISILLSLVLHLGTLLLVDRLFFAEREIRSFRARLVAPPRFEAKPKMHVVAPSLPSVDMEFMRTAEGPVSVPEDTWAPPTEVPEAVLPQLEAYDPTLPKRDGAELVIEALPDPTGPTRTDTAASEAMELVRIEDLIRADRERAVIVPDFYSRRDTRGFVKFTPLRLDGAWSYALDATGGGRPVLADLARYLRDHTQVYAELRGFPVQYFNAPPLLQDPVHFFFPGLQRGSTNGPRIALSPQEQTFLGEYLRGGGFLFADAGQGPDDRRFLREVVALLKAVLGAEGRLFALPADHAVYHAFYSYEKGFPGEDKRPVVEVAGSNWHYPDRAPCSSRSPRGLYGVEWQGHLVASISDLDLHRRWSGLALPCAEEGEETEGEVGAGAEEEAEAPAKTPYLQAATNIVFHALTRPGGVAVKRLAPAWERRQKASIPAAVLESEWVVADQELLDELEASLALLRAPLGKRIGEGGLRLRIDGALALELANERLHGVLIRNLAAGLHWIEVEYEGEHQGMEIELRGGKVTTVAFSRRGLGFWTSLSLKPLAERFGMEGWNARFGDLGLEQVYLEIP